jgi:CRP/FNR family cyclic AMP-dependent transcriptional regulator
MLPRKARTFDPIAFLAQTGLGRTILLCPKNKVIFAQGDPSDAVFYIQTGRARLTVLSTRGKEATIALVGEGDFIGEACITTDQPRRVASATAITDCRVLRIEKAAMLDVLHREHAFQICSSPISSAAIIRRRPTWSISSSTPPKSGWPGLSCCWLVLARKGVRKT